MINDILIIELQKRGIEMLYNFPKETMEIIYGTAKHFNLTPEETLSKAIGLLELFKEADSSNKVWIEKPINALQATDTQISL